MDWKGGRESRNVQDRRGLGVKAGGGVGVVGIVVVLIGWFLGVDPSVMLGLVDGVQSSTNTASSYSQSAGDDEQSQFVRVMLGANEDFWNAELKRYGVRFHAPQLVLFSDRTQSACGMASMLTGPFYCPADQKIYVDLRFIQSMQRLGATRSTEVAGNFAMAYVIGHEYGHHISNLIGVLPKAHQAMQSAGSRARANEISVRLELQADCFAGVWAANLSHYRIRLTQADLQAGLRAASAVGDDRIMQGTGQQVRQENFTHGSSAQRMQWFNRGLNRGDMSACDTFS